MARFPARPPTAGSATGRSATGRSPFRNLHQKPGLDGGEVSNPQLDFLLKHGMVTREEFDAVVSGNAKIENRKYIVPLNMAGKKNGMRFKLYPGRVDDLVMHEMLDLPTDF